MTFKKKYLHFNRFIYRTPINPYSHFNYTDSTNLSAIFQESLYIASPDLYAALEKKNFENYSKDEKLNESSYKYVSRTCFRSTPFGSFSGIGSGTIEDRNSIRLKHVSEYKTYTRLDMTYLCALIESLSQNPDVKSKLRYKLNSSIYKFLDDYRYIEYKIESKKRLYFLAEAEADDAMDYLFANCKNYTAYNDLVAVFAEEFEVEQQEAIDYIDSLIDSQILVNDIEPNVSGTDLLDALIANLDQHQIDVPEIQHLKKTKQLLSQIDSSPLGTKLSLYKQVEQELELLGIPFDRQLLFQSDLLIASEQATIDKNLIDDLNQGIIFLNKFLKPNSPEGLNNFKKDFHRKYENAMIPLHLALDADVGIGIGNLTPFTTDLTPLLKRKFFNSAAASDSITVSKSDLFLNKKYREFLVNRDTEMVISDKDLEEFKEDWDNFPSTFSAFIEVLDSSPEQQPYIYLSYVTGSAANLTARFSHLNAEIEDIVDVISNKESELAGDTRIMAEVVHLPQSRNGNILFRNSRRKYEIPYLAKSLNEEEFQIDVSDILVGVPNGEKVVLWSKKHNKEIIPKNTNAYNFNLNPVAMHLFLCTVQAQERNGLQFSWGSLLGSEAFLPRVVYKKVILSPATWNISLDEVREFKNSIDTDSFYEKAREFASKKNLPEKVLFVAGDNKLFIDFGNITAVKILFRSLVKSGGVLHEFFEYKNAIIHQGDKGYRNEIIINYHSNTN